MPKSIGILGRKIGMTRVYDELGKAAPVTVIEAGPCIVLQKKTKKAEGYGAIQVGFVTRRDSRTNKPESGHAAKAGKGCFYHISEFRVENPEAYEVGQEIVAGDLFKIGDEVHVSGRTKGRGFQGVVKRHSFSGGKKTHGSMFHRRPGSIGCSAWPSRVVKGKKMPGHMGTNRVTQKNLKIMDIRSEENIILLKGSIPGAQQDLLQIFTK